MTLVRIMDHINEFYNQNHGPYQWILQSESWIISVTLVRIMDHINDFYNQNHGSYQLILQAESLTLSIDF